MKSEHVARVHEMRTESCFVEKENNRETVGKGVAFWRAREGIANQPTITGLEDLVLYY